MSTCIIKSGSAGGRRHHEPKDLDLHNFLSSSNEPTTFCPTSQSGETQTIANNYSAPKWLANYSTMFLLMCLQTSFRKLIFGLCVVLFVLVDTAAVFCLPVPWKSGLDYSYRPRPPLITPRGGLLGGPPRPQPPRPPRDGGPYPPSSLVGGRPMVNDISWTNFLKLFHILARLFYTVTFFGC